MSAKFFFFSVACSFVISLRGFFCLFLKIKPQTDSYVSSCEHFVMGGSKWLLRLGVFNLRTDGSGPWCEKMISRGKQIEGDATWGIELLWSSAASTGHL